MKHRVIQYAVWTTALSLALLGATNVYAQEAVGVNVDDNSVVSVEAVAAVTSFNDDTVATSTPATTTALEGVTINTSAKAPGAFGLWWRGIRERVSLAFTADPVKKAEKELQFAEERIQIAQKIAADSSNPDAQARAEAVISRANEFMTNIQAKKDELLKNPDERATRLLKNIAIHTENSQTVLDRIEKSLPEDKQAKFAELRQKVEDNGQQFLKVLDNANLPAAAKEHLQQVKQRIEAVRQVQKDFREGRRDIIKDARMDGGVNSSTMKEVRELRQDSRSEIKDIRSSTEERPKVMLREKIEQKMSASGTIREQVMEKRREGRDDRMEKVSSTEKLPLPLRALRNAKELPQKVEERNQPIDIEIQQ